MYNNAEELERRGKLEHFFGMKLEGKKRRSFVVIPILIFFHF
jgi:hypothetical protein